jgi:chromosome segregation ATPase
MSFFDPYSRSSFVVGCSLVLSGFGVGFAVNEYFSEHFRKVESFETSRLSNDVQTLQQQLLARDESVQTLTEQLSRARQELVALQSNVGSSNYSSQVSNQKYSDLSQQYARVSGMYSDLQTKYQTAQQNCSALGRINDLEVKRSRLERELSGLQYDVHAKDIDDRRRGLQLLLEQNSQQLISLQQHLSR